MKAAILWLFALILRPFGLRPAPMLCESPRTCTFCASPVCRACRLVLQTTVVDGEYCSERCKRIEESDRRPDHVVQPFTDAFVDMKFDEP